MARYRATPVTQRDGSALASSNCRMASIATGLDYHTLGVKTSTGKKMRESQGDQSGGTDSGDAVQAWQRHGETLSVQDGQTWDRALVDLKAGRMVHIDVWHAAAGGPCLSGSGAYGHTMVIAPEKNGTKWLVCDPWCAPAKWTWWEESKLKAGAEKWGGMVYNRAAQTSGWDDGNIDVRRAILKAVVLYLMSKFTPDKPAEPGEEPDDTGGAGRVLYTRTQAHGEQSDISGGNMTIQSHGDVTSNDKAKMLRDTDILKSPGGTRIATAPKGKEYPYIGSALKEDNSGSGYRACLVNTALVYADGVARPTVLYIKSGDMEVIQGVPVPPPPSGDCTDEVAAALVARDKEWQEWLLAGNPSET